MFTSQPHFGNEISNSLAKHTRVIATPHSTAQIREAKKGKEVLKIIENYMKSSNPYQLGEC
ncbi:MAG: hypothetical protein QXI23_01040 [Candidatus Aenigmatarchaeota archaeon]